MLNTLKPRLTTSGKKCIPLLILNFSFLIFNSFAQAPSWLWAKSAGGTVGDYGQGIATDASGNVYVTGYFESPAITFGAFTLTNAGTNDIFIVKYDAGGNVLWAKSAGGGGADWGMGIATDASGNVYVTGLFSVSPATFDTITLSNSGFSDIFIAKYDGSGNVLWARKAGGSSFDYGQSIATDAGGNVYITGKFRSAPAVFGSINLSNTTSATYDIFAAKYDSNGNVLWAKSAGGAADDNGLSIAADAGGNAYVTGYFYSTSFTFGSTTLTNGGSGTGDIFILKYDAAGNAQWAKSAGGSGGDWGYSITADAGGNIYTTGYYNSLSVTFGSITLTNTTGTRIFIVKYDGSGNALWATSDGGPLGAFDIAYGITTDASANLYLTGTFQGASTTIGSTTLTNAGYIDIFIAKYDSSGNAQWATSAGGTVGDYGLSIATSGGNVYVTGYFESTSIPFGSDTLINGGGNNPDVFVAKLSSVVGTNEINRENFISLFPDPASDQLVVGSVQWAVKEIEIYDVLGERVFSQQPIAKSQQQTINISSLTSGIYFVKVKGEKGERAAKFVKQ